MSAIRQGARTGLAVFIAYGIVESLFATLLPWILGRSDVLEWETTAVLLAVYAAAGLVLGALAGLAVQAVGHSQSHAAMQAAAVLALTIPYALNLVQGQRLVVTALPLGAAAAASAVALLSAGTGAWAQRLRPFAGPWTVSLLLVGVPSISKEFLWNRPAVVRALGAGACLAAVLVLSYVMRNVAVRPSAVAAFAVLLPFLCFALNQSLKVPGPDALGPSPASGKPNIILLVLDTVRADHLSVYGYERETTPELKRLAQEATVFTSAISASDMTLATHASIFTGMYPTWHHAHYAPDSPFGRPLAARAQTLAEILAENGYVTMGVAANRAYLQHAYALDQGFACWNVAHGFLFEKDAFYLRQGVRSLLMPVLAPYAGMSYARAADVNRDVFRLLDSVRQSKRPFFLFVNYMDAHWPYSPPRPFNSLFSGRGPAMTDFEYNRMLNEVMTSRRAITQATRRHMISQYDGSIAYLDSEVAKLVRRLKALDMYDNTLLIVTSDHGEAFGERALVGHGVSVYQNQIHVPLIIKYPKSYVAAVVEEPVSSVDLMPTALGLAGCPVPAGVQGESLLKAGKTPREIMAESFPSRLHYDLSPRFHRVERAIFDGSRKLIASTAGKRELYDIARDPGEERDLAPSEQTVAADLQARLTGSLKAVLADSRTAPDPRRVLGKEDLDRLKSLGYVQ